MRVELVVAENQESQWPQKKLQKGSSTQRYFFFESYTAPTKNQCFWDY
jgi:hypothetical protein